MGVFSSQKSLSGQHSEEYIHLYSPSPNASLQLHTEGKDSFLDTKERLQVLIVLWFCMWYTHFDSTNCIFPLNMYKNLYKQIPLHPLKMPSALKHAYLAA